MENNSELLGWKRNQQFEKRFFTLGSRLSGWHKPQPKCLALSANGLVQGIDPRPYATSIRYWCPRNGWGFPSNGEWSNLDTIEQCEKLSYPRRLVAGGWWLAALCRRRQWSLAAAWTQEPSLPHTGDWWGPTLETMGQTLHLSCHSTFHHMSPCCVLTPHSTWQSGQHCSYLCSVQLET